MKKALFVAAMSVALVVASRPAFAHHAAGNYDTEHPITLTGTITEYRLVSPHTQIFFDVKDEQGRNVTSWVALSGPPTRIYRARWKTKKLKQGDKDTVTRAPTKDGKKFMGLRKIIGPTGEALPAEGGKIARTAEIDVAAARFLTILRTIQAAPLIRAFPALCRS